MLIILLMVGGILIVLINLRMPVMCEAFSAGGYPRQGSSHSDPILTADRTSLPNSCAKCAKRAERRERGPPFPALMTELAQRLERAAATKSGWAR